MMNQSLKSVPMTIINVIKNSLRQTPQVVKNYSRVIATCGIALGLMTNSGYTQGTVSGKPVESTKVTTAPSNQKEIDLRTSHPNRDDLNLSGISSIQNVIGGFERELNVLEYHLAQYFEKNLPTARDQVVWQAQFLNEKFDEFEKNLNRMLKDAPSVIQEPMKEETKRLIHHWRDLKSDLDNLLNDNRRKRPIEVESSLKDMRLALVQYKDRTNMFINSWEEWNRLDSYAKQAPLVALVGIGLSLFFAHSCSRSHQKDEKTPEDTVIIPITRSKLRRFI
ncbi:MAG: hypothetical protein NZT61_00025 [Deltaproteobacteria bacterium]|nr:hypothetical protein [Deltaproteobacteria bacterium]